MIPQTPYFFKRWIFFLVIFELALSAGISFYYYLQVGSSDGFLRGGNFFAYYFTKEIFFQLAFKPSIIISTLVAGYYTYKKFHS